MTETVFMKKETSQKSERPGRRGKGGKKTLYAALLIASMAGVVAGVFEVQNFDIWWHLETGELIVTEGTIPTSDPFSYTVRGQPWITHEWLSEVIFFLVHESAGIRGLIILKSLLLGAAVALLLSLAVRKRGTTIPFLLFPVFLFPLALRPFVRPHIFTFFFTCLLLILVSVHRETGNRKWLIPLPVVFLLWANIHSGVVLGLIILLAFTFGSALSRKISGGNDVPADAGYTKTLAAFFFASLAASLVNPHHVETLIYPFLLARNPVFTRTIAELKGPLEEAYAFSFWQVGFLALFPVVAAVAWFTRRFRDLAWMIPLALYATLSFFAHRNVPTFAALALAFTAVSLSSLPRTRSSGSKKKPLRVRLATSGRVLSIAVPALSLILLLTRGAYMGEDGWRAVGIGVRTEQYPGGAFRFLEEEEIHGNMFNQMAFGGFLIYEGYPEYRVFIDGRLLLYGDRFSRRYLDAYYGSQGLDALLERYDIGYFILDYPDEADNRMIQYALSRSRDWELVYWDDNALIYVRNAPGYSSVIEEHAYRSVDPIYRLGFQLERQIERDPDGFTAEVERQLALRPETAISRVFLGAAYEKAGRYREASVQYEMALARDPSRTDLRDKIYMMRMQDRALGRTGAEEEAGDTGEAPSALARGMGFLSMRRYEEAQDALLEAVRESPGNANAHYNLAIAYRALGLQGQARKTLEKAVELNPGHIDAHNDLGIIYAVEGRHEKAVRQFERALSIDPRHTSSLYNLALAYRKAGRIPDAVRTLERLLEISPDHRNASPLLEALKQEQGVQPDEAGAQPPG